MFFAGSSKVNLSLKVWAVLLRPFNRPKPPRASNLRTPKLRLFPHIAFISLGTEHIRVLRPRPHARVFSDAPYPQENVTKLESHFTRRPSRYRRGLPPRRGRARHFWCFSFPRFILSPAQLEALNLTREACLHVPKKKAQGYKLGCRKYPYACGRGLRFDVGTRFENRERNRKLIPSVTAVS